MSIEEVRELVGQNKSNDRQIIIWIIKQMYDILQKLNIIDLKPTNVFELEPKLNELREQKPNTESEKVENYDLSEGKKSYKQYTVKKITKGFLKKYTQGASGLRKKTRFSKSLKLVRNFFTSLDRLISGKTKDIYRDLIKFIKACNDIKNSTIDKNVALFYAGDQKFKTAIKELVNNFPATDNPNTDTADGIKKRWVMKINGQEIYDDSKPLLAQVIYDLKFHKDFKDWEIDDELFEPKRSIPWIRNLVVAESNQGLENRILNTKIEDRRKILGEKGYKPANLSIYAKDLLTLPLTAHGNEGESNWRRQVVSEGSDSLRLCSRCSEVLPLVLREKYRESLPEKRIKAVEDYVEQFRGTAYHMLLCDRTKFDHYAELLSAEFGEGVTSTFNDFEQQLILVELLQDIVSEADLMESEYSALSKLRLHGLASQVTRLYRDFVLGSKTTRKTLLDLITILKSQGKKKEKPYCKRCYQSMCNLYEKLTKNQNGFSAEYMTAYDYENLKIMTKSGYDEFRKTAHIGYITKDLARHTLKDKYSTQDIKLANNKDPITRLLDYYYSQEIEIYLSEVENEIDRKLIRQILDTGFLKRNCNLSGLLELVRSYKQTCSNVKDSEFNEGLCYQFVRTMQALFSLNHEGKVDQKEEFEKDPEEYAVGAFGLDFPQALYVLDSVVQRATDNFLNTDKTPDKIYDEFIAGLQKAMERLKYPGSIKKTDPRFVNFVRALKSSSNGRCEKLLELIAKTYCRLEARKISEQLNETERSKLIDMLDIHNFDKKELTDVLQKIPKISDKLRNGKSKIDSKKFSAAYIVASDKKQKEIAEIFVEIFDSLSPVHPSEWELTELAAKDKTCRIEFDDFTLPDWFPEDEKDRDAYCALVGYTLTSIRDPFAGCQIDIKNEKGNLKYVTLSENTPPHQRYEYLPIFLSNKKYQIKIKELIQAATKTDLVEEMKKKGMIYIALQDGKDQKKILSVFRNRKLESSLERLNLPGMFIKLYKNLEEPEFLKTAADLLEINNQSAEIDDVFHVLLRCPPAKFRNIMKSLQCGNKDCRYELLSLGTKENLYKVIELLKLDDSLWIPDTNLVHDTEIRKTREFCSGIIRLVLHDIVHQRRDVQNMLLLYLKQAGCLPDFAKLSNEELLKIFRSIRPVELETINSQVFRVLMGGSTDNSLLDFAEEDYSGSVNSHRLGSVKHDNDDWGHRNYNLSNFKTELVKDQYVNNMIAGNDITAGFAYRRLYTKTEEGRLLREAIGVPEIHSDSFAKTVKLTMKYSDRSSAVPTEKFYKLPPLPDIVDDNYMARWLNLRSTTGYSLNYPGISGAAKIRTKWTNFYANWCIGKKTTEKDWVIGDVNLMTYVLNKYPLFKINDQMLNNEDIVKDPLMIGIAVFEKLARKLNIKNRTHLEKLPVDKQEDHPLSILLHQLLILSISTDNKCTQEALELYKQWQELVRDAYCELDQTVDLNKEPTDYYKQKLFSACRKKAMSNLVDMDPSSVHPVFGMEIGGQLRFMYAEALNVPAESAQGSFDIRTSDACGTAEFVTPAAPNRIRAENASKSLNLGSIITTAKEMNITAFSQKAMDEIKKKTMNKPRSFDEIVHVLDEKSLLLTVNETSIYKEKTDQSDKKHYYFGTPDSFDESWSFQSRLKQLTEKLKKGFEPNKTENPEAKKFLSDAKPLSCDSLRNWVKAKIMKESNITTKQMTTYSEYNVLLENKSNKTNILQNHQESVDYYTEKLTQARKDIESAKSLSDDTDFQNPEKSLESMFEQYNITKTDSLNKNIVIMHIKQEITELKSELHKKIKTTQKTKIELKDIEKKITAKLKTLGGKTVLDKITAAMKKTNDESLNMQDEVTYILYKKLKNWVHTSSSENLTMTVEELLLLLSLCSTIYVTDSENNEILNGSTVLLDCKLDRFGANFSTDILPLYLVDEGYIEI